MMFYLSIIVIILLFITGMYSLLMIRSTIRVLISLEILIKAVTLLIILTGYVTNRIALAQSMVITLIIIEVVAVATGSGIAVGLFRHYNTLDMNKIRSLKRQGN